MWSDSRVPGLTGSAAGAAATVDGKPRRTNWVLEAEDPEDPNVSVVFNLPNTAAL